MTIKPIPEYLEMMRPQVLELFSLMRAMFSEGVSKIDVFSIINQKFKEKIVHMDIPEQVVIMASSLFFNQQVIDLFASDPDAHLHALQINENHDDEGNIKIVVTPTFHRGDESVLVQNPITEVRKEQKNGLEETSSQGIIPSPERIKREQNEEAFDKLMLEKYERKNYKRIDSKLKKLFANA